MAVFWYIALVDSNEPTVSIISHLFITLMMEAVSSSESPSLSTRLHGPTSRKQPSSFLTGLTEDFEEKSRM
jgi:hypothetical protein